MGLEVDSGPNLLLDWHESTDSRPWIQAAIGSVIVHILLFLIALGIGSLDAPQMRSATEIVSNLQHVTLVMPADLTQKAPNKTKVSKEVNVEDLKPRRASEKLPPAPAPRIFKPPKPQPQRAPTPQPGSPNDPPKLEAATLPNLPPPPAGLPKPQPPPQIQPEEKPKLAFETPGMQGTNPEHSNVRIPVPKPSVQDAINSVARGAGQRGLSVGDFEEPPTLPESAHLTQLPGRPGSSLELLSDPQGVDFRPYLMQILARVRRNWFAVWPESARLGSEGVVLLQFAIDRSGQVPKLVIALPSGTESLDRAAVAGISASVPFPPLPNDFKGKEVRLQFSFKYNIK